MKTLQVNESQNLALDKNGYLANLDDWSEAVAEAFAREDGITLSAEHWDIVLFVRQFYQEYETSPAIRILVKALKQKYGEKVGSSRYLQSLFPEGPAKMACKYAGLPKPAKCL